MTLSGVTVVSWPSNAPAAIDFCTHPLTSSALQLSSRDILISFVVWCCGVVVLWCCGVVVLWCGAM